MTRRAIPTGYAPPRQPYPPPYGARGRADLAGSHYGVVGVDGLRAIGSLTIPAGAPGTIIDEQRVTLTDALAQSRTYAFDTVPDGTVAGDVAVDISGAATVSDVRNFLLNAIIADAANIDITAVAVGADGIFLVQNTGGAAGNTAIVEAGLGDSLTPVNFAGGADPSVVAPARCGPAGRFL